MFYLLGWLAFSDSEKQVPFNSSICVRVHRVCMCKCVHVGMHECMCTCVWGKQRESKENYTIVAFWCLIFIFIYFLGLVSYTCTQLVLNPLPYTPLGIIRGRGASLAVAHWQCVYVFLWSTSFISVWRPNIGLKWGRNRDTLLPKRPYYYFQLFAWKWR